MVKVRKMLGDVNSPECLAMMRLIETQSEVTLARWALSYVREHVLPIYMEKNGEDCQLCTIVQACQTAVEQNPQTKTLKIMTKEALQIARETEDPVAQAAARAAAAACGTLTTPTNALGFLFYAAAKLMLRLRRKP